MTNRLGDPKALFARAPITQFTRLALRDLRPAADSQPTELDAHMRAAIEWLERAHDMSPDDGVCHSYSLKGGWRKSYVETTGYIIETFYDLANDHQMPQLAERARRMAFWLLKMQLADGSFPNIDMNPDSGLVFDTGQDLFGLVRGYRETGDQRLLDGAVRAADWLVRVADEHGCWTQSTYKNVPHVYNTRTAWALLELNAVNPAPDYERVARANLDWACSQQNDLGWFDNCAFERDVAPFTHTIAYATRGLLESARLLNDERYLKSACHAASVAAEMVHQSGFLAGQIAVDGTPVNSYCCLTGNCQFAIVWAKLYTHFGDERFASAAQRALQYVASRQPLREKNPDIRGGIAGSYPIWGRYHRLQYPNWAAKFFIEAALLVREIR